MVKFGIEEECKVSYLLMCLVCVTLKCIEGAHNVVKNFFEGAF